MPLTVVLHCQGRVTQNGQSSPAGYGSPAGWALVVYPSSQPPITARFCQSVSRP